MTPARRLLSGTYKFLLKGYALKNITQKPYKDNHNLSIWDEVSVKAFQFPESGLRNSGIEMKTENTLKEMKAKITEDKLVTSQGTAIICVVI